jgi:hypothetical protein
MTTTQLDYFDKTPGTLEQLVLGVVTQKLINRDYVPELLRTDFTSNSVSYSVTSDSGDNGTNNANLAISITVPTVPYARQILTDKEGFDKRVMSVNSLNIDTLSLPQKPDYPIKSFPAQLPEYLDQAVPENILERRLMALCLHIRNYRNWVQRWNALATQWRFVKYQAHWNVNPNIIYPVYETLPLIEIERLRDDLLLELSTRIKFKKIVPFDIVATFPISGSVVGDPSSAQELIEFLNNGEVSDPANENQSPLSSQLLDDLYEAAQSNESNNGFSLPSSEPQFNIPDEKPTLPNC